MVSEGDHVHELYVVLAGLMESFKPGIGETADDVAVAVGPDVEGSMHGTSSRYTYNPNVSCHLILHLLSGSLVAH